MPPPATCLVVRSARGPGGPPERTEDLARTPPDRIVSLLPSATEILCALGLEQRLVGRSHECDFPPQVESLPIVSRPWLDAAERGSAIHGAILARGRTGLSFYQVDAAALARLRPELIVTQDQCAVCAVSSADVEAATRTMTGCATEILSLRPHSLGDVWTDVARIGAATARESAAAELVAHMQLGLAALAGEAGRPRPTVLCLEWLEPPMVGGGWIPELVMAAGGEPLLVDAPGPFQVVSWDQVHAAAPDFLFVFPCGYPLAKTLRELDDPALTVALAPLAAVRRGRAFACDGNAFFNRSGPRLVESAEILCGLLHPGAAPLRERHAAAWRPLAAR